MTEKTLGYARSAVSALALTVFVDPLKASLAQGIGEQIKGIVVLAEKVVDQTRRRVIDGEKVPASEKIVSIFEPNTDIIVKDRRDTFYGHKCSGSRKIGQKRAEITLHLPVHRTQTGPPCPVW